MRLPHLAFALSLLAFAAPAAPDPVEQAETALASHSDSFSIDDRPQGSAAMAAYWKVLTAGTLGILNSRPDAPAAALVKALPSDPKDPKFTATALGPDLIELDLHYGEMGDVLLLTRRGGRFGVAWDAAKLGPGDVRRFPILAAWAIDHARQGCRTKMPEGQWDRCGPIHGGVLPLPPDRAGHARFALDATYAQAMGFTVGGQVSLWSWDGARATPLLARAYSFMIDQHEGVRLDGDILRVREKDEFKSFTSCGQCLGRQVDWSLRIAPDGITDLGTASTMPELDALDGLVDAIRRGASTRALASNQVVALLKPDVDGARNDARLDQGHFFSLGMVMAGEVSAQRHSRRLCFSTDNMEKPVLFTLTTWNGRIFLARAAVAAGADCPK